MVTQTKLKTTVYEFNEIWESLGGHPESWYFVHDFELVTQ
jgi:hypothetical protein